MHVAVPRYDGVTRLAKVAQQVKKGFVPIMSEMPGSSAYYFVDAETA